MEKDYPYTTEYAKTSRASCKLCKDGITKDTLRMAVMVQSPRFDGKMPNWYHFECFFKKVKLRSLDDIKHIETLRWEDQEKIKSKISTSVIESPVSDISIEYAKSNRSKCGKCEEKINKGDIRISRMETSSDKAKMLGPLKSWHHINCFIQLKTEILQSNANFDFEKIAGFKSLTEEDNKTLSTKFKSWKSKKRSIDDSDNNNNNNNKGPVIKKIKLENDLDDQLKAQSQLIWDLRDKLNSEVNKNTLISLLELNKQYVPKGEANLLNSVADCLVFGCLNACPECGGHLEYSSNRYQCRSMINEWARCLYSTKDVKRSRFKISEEYLEADVLRNYKYKERNRILPPDPENLRNLKPLAGFSVVIDKIPFPEKYSKIEIKNRIKDLGGIISKHPSSESLVLISSSEGIQNKASFGVRAKSFLVDVVSVEFLNDLENENLFEAVKKYSVTDWGRPKDELEKLSKNDKNLENRYKKGNSRILTVKGGAVVDPDSKLETKAHVYQDPKTLDPLNAILGMADITRGSNSFYKLQLLSSDKKNKWWVFRSWGRIGTSIGGNKLEQYDDLESAIENFNEVYLDKTGNHWKNRKKFMKFPNKFSPIDIDYGEEAKNRNIEEENSSFLPKSVENLIRFIFDMESMKRAMLEFEIDLNKMPLGKLSKKQIDLSYNLLKELQDLLINNEASTSKLFELSNKFYTMMPHNFGMRTPPLINSLTMVKDKCEMIESLMEIEVAYKLMSIENGKITVDSQYEKLHNRISPMDKNSEEFKRLELYLKNTHAPTHTDYKIILHDIYDISRDGESDRYHPFRKLPNRMMLWHGSRRTNWAGILSQGLRIAPPEAPMTGYMFGKGVYFADMVSKSANYCHTNSKSPDGILMLCEVALGKMVEKYKCDGNIKLKSGEHSCKGVGATMPDPADNYIDTDGVVYPIGKPIQQEVKSDLLYNEYIVYDIGQIKQKYLFKVRFDYQS